MSNLKVNFLKLIKEMLLATPLKKYLLPSYSSYFSVPQLCFLCQCIEKTRGVPGSIVEVGCEKGRTTLFLNKYMTAQRIEKDYFAIDTFSGFITGDIKYESSISKKNQNSYLEMFKMHRAFQLNRKKWFDETMRINDIKRVRSIQADVKGFNFNASGRSHFACWTSTCITLLKSLCEHYIIICQTVGSW